MDSEIAILITCEHASKQIPSEFAAILKERKWREDELWDAGASLLAEGLARRFQVPLFQGEVSRLVVDLNRRPDHKRWSRIKSISKNVQDKQNLLARYHNPFREAAQAYVEKADFCIHFSVHSFVRNFRGKVRTTDIGILSDPARQAEASFARRAQRFLRQHSRYRIHRNRPYFGNTDGHATNLRTQFGQGRYLGFELEICSDLIQTRGDDDNHRLIEILFKALKESLSEA